MVRCKLKIKEERKKQTESLNSPKTYCLTYFSSTSTPLFALQISFSPQYLLFSGGCQWDGQWPGPWCMELGSSAQLSMFALIFSISPLCFLAPNTRTLAHSLALYCTRYNHVYLMFPQINVHLMCGRVGYYDCTSCFVYTSVHLCGKGNCCFGKVVAKNLFAGMHLIAVLQFHQS